MDLLEDARTLENLKSYGESVISMEEAEAMARDVGAIGVVPYSSYTGQVRYLTPLSKKNIYVN